MADTLLKITGLKVSYGGIKAVKGIDLEVHEGELISLIGSNGAGKTTTMKAVTGSLPFEGGDIEYLGKSIKGRGAWDMVKQGLAMVPEGRGVFTRMTIIENLQMGAYIRTDQAGIASDMERMFGIFPRLKERQHTEAGVLSGGEQQMLTLCRTLMGDPDLVIIDEPTEGLAPKIVDLVGQYLQSLKGRGISVLLIEQKLTIAMAISDRVLVMGHGSIVFDGTPASLREDAGTRQEWLEV